MNENLTEKIVKKSGSSFASAMKLLPEERRNAMYAVYAFCRVIDDIADGEDVYEVKIKNLDFWRKEIDAVFRQKPETELGKSLSGYVDIFKLDAKDFIAVIDGMAMDLPDGIKAPSDEDLELYCSRVAGAVGLISIKIFGEDDDNARSFALNLGEALQLTNIIRDVKEDADMGRLYISKSILNKAEIFSDNPLDVIKSPNLTEALSILCGKAEQKYQQAKANLRKASFAKMYPAFIMMKVYEKVLQKTKKRGFQILEPKIKPNLVDLLLIIMETLLRRFLCRTKKPSI
ncbi:MAG: presqualene diphosphate synthase HpnD [Alphaproteobacteria bacterium]